MSELSVLIGYQGSNAARRAIDAAAGLFADAKAIVTHVDQPVGLAVTPGAAAGVPPAVPVATPPEHVQRQASESIVEEGVELARQAGLQPIPATAHAGSERAIADALLEQADRHGASVIVVGSGDKSLIDRALLGSVSEKLVHDSDRPVLVVPGHVDDGRHHHERGQPVGHRQR